MQKKFDLFPAVVYLAPPESLEDFTTLLSATERPQGTRRVDRSRVCLVDNVVYIVVDSPEGPKVVFREAISAYEKAENKQDHSVVTQSGKILAVTKDKNCGCGSKLRTWNPFRNQLSASGDPSE